MDFSKMAPGDIIPGRGVRAKKMVANMFNDWAQENRPTLIALNSIDDKGVHDMRVHDLISIMPSGLHRLPFQNVLAAWLQESTAPSDWRASDPPRTSDAWAAYVAWLVSHGVPEHHAHPVNTFGRALRGMPGIASRRRPHGTVVLGIALNPPADLA